MEDKKIYVTFCDLNRLKILLDSATITGYRNEKTLYLLKTKLKRASVVAPESIPSNVVTINSTFKFRNLLTDKVMTFTIVYPKDADITKRKISILTPVGASVFGYSCGDTVHFEAPVGVFRLKIEQILYQPEANGVYLS